MIVVIYINNLLLFRWSLCDIKSIKASIKAKFQTKDLGEAKVCFGIHIIRDQKNQTLCIDQLAYVCNIL